MERLRHVLWPLFTFAAGTLASVAGVAAQVEILSPQAGAELRGRVEVVARVVRPRGTSLDRVMLQTAGGEQIRMAPRFADTYAAEVDTTSLRNGRQRLLVLASPKGRDESRFRPDRMKTAESPLRTAEAEVEVVVRNAYEHYWGDLHAHTSYSDGCRLPADAYRYARDTAKLDFFAVTDHSQLLTLEEYEDVIAQADHFDQAGRFVTLYGAESTESTGHLNFYMAATPRLPVGLDARYRAIGEMGLLGHFNHPKPTTPEGQGWSDDFEGFHYAPVADEAMAVVEVRNLVEETCYIRMLDLGWHVGAAGCQDQHQATWGTGGSSWTVALARELTREGILEALRARRTYSAGDRNLRLDLVVDGEDMGARVARRAGSLNCVITLSDPDDGDLIDLIELFVDGRLVKSVRPKLTAYAWAVPVELAPGQHYCFVRVRQVGDKMTWSSPVWVSAY